MKKLLILLIILFSCQQRQPENKNLILVDTTGMYKNSFSTDTGTIIQTQKINSSVKPKTRIIYRGGRTIYRDRTVYSRESTVNRKRGWSHAAKGAVIGGVGGAVVGGIIGKGKGAVIGGIIGGGGGYIIGRKKDKREGRWN